MDTPRQPPWDDEKNAVDLPARFAPHEHWAWARIIRGLSADMCDYPGPREGAFAAFSDWLAGKDDGHGWDANEMAPKEEGQADAAEEGEQKLKPWPDHRQLSVAFIRLILFEAPYTTCRARPWVRFTAAHFTEGLIWENERCDAQLGLYACRFDQDLRWLGMHFAHPLNLSGSRMEGNFFADGMVLHGSLFCRNKTYIGQDLRLAGAHIMGNAEFDSANLRGRLVGDNMTVDGGLFCRSGFTAAGRVGLSGARVGGYLDFIDSRLDGDLICDDLVVERALFLREVKRMGDASLIGARVTGAVQLSDSVIEGVVDLTGARILGELQTGQRAHQVIKWSGDARLILRNASVGALAGAVDTFPSPTKDNPTPMDLSGLSYERIGGMGAGAGGSLAQATPKQLKAWLSAGHPRRVFTPAPYQQLAAALTDAGHAATANVILHEMRKHERDCERNWLRRFMLGLSGMFIGFGHRNDYAVYWFTLLVFLFAAIGLNWHGLRPLDVSHAGFSEFFRWLGFSLGNAIPVVNLDKAHETFLAARFNAFTDGQPDPGQVPVGVAWTFYFQKLLGLFVLSFLAAGLTGLAQRGAAGSGGKGG